MRVVLTPIRALLLGKAGGKMAMNFNDPPSQTIGGHKSPPK